MKPQAQTHRKVFQLRATLKDLTATDWRTLHELCWLTTCRERTHPASPAYVTPGQRYLAAATDTCRETASRATTRLHALGVICKTRRRKVRGTWQTCL